MIAHLGDDLQKAFPGESGFSRTNVYRMRALFLAYQGAEKIVPQLVGQISESGLPMAIAELPWGQNVVLIEQIKDLRERLWYARATFEHGWSRAVLAHWIESDLYKRQGKAQTNFEKTLPALPAAGPAEVPGRSDPPTRPSADLQRPPLGRTASSGSRTRFFLRSGRRVEVAACRPMRQRPGQGALELVIRERLRERQPRLPAVDGEGRAPDHD